MAERSRPSQGPSRGPARHRGAAHRVRIIGGQWRRTPLPVANLPGLRPTPDRVRETVFNWLAHLKPDLSQVVGLDLFAGTGALGVELASRGAKRVVLVERQAALLVALKELRERLGASCIEIHGGDAVALAQRLPPGGFDVIFLDPPYDAGLLEPTLAIAARLLAPAGIVYAEAPVALAEAQLAPHGFAVVREGRAGKVRYYLLRCNPS